MYVSIKLFHYGISISMGLFRPEIPILMGLFYSRIPIFMVFSHSGIPILIGLSQILNRPYAETALKNELGLTVKKGKVETSFEFS